MLHGWVLFLCYYIPSSKDGKSLILLSSSVGGIFSKSHSLGDQSHQGVYSCPYLLIIKQKSNCTLRTGHQKQTLIKCLLERRTLIDFAKQGIPLNNHHFDTLIRWSNTVDWPSCDHILGDRFPSFLLHLNLVHDLRLRISATDLTSPLQIFRKPIKYPWSWSSCKSDAWRASLWCHSPVCLFGHTNHRGRREYIRDEPNPSGSAWWYDDLNFGTLALGCWPRIVTEQHAARHHMLRIWLAIWHGMVGAHFIAG